MHIKSVNAQITSTITRKTETAFDFREPISLSALTANIREKYLRKKVKETKNSGIKKLKGWLF